MKIGFEAKRAFQNRTGLGNYSRTLISNYSQYNHEDELHLFSPQLTYSDWLNSDSMHLHHAYGPKFLHSFWKTHLQSIQANLLNLDIFHGLSNELPHFLSPTIKKVVTIHDTIFWRFPELYPFFDRTSYFYKTQYAIKNADKIIAISEMTKKDLIHYFAADPAKIEVLYQTCHHQFYNKAEASELKKVRDKYQLPEKFILNVGTLEPRKNALMILEALNLLPHKIHLVLIGKGKEYKEQIFKFIKDHQLAKQVTILNNVEFEDLPKIYQSSSLFLYPSHFEGFGIPIIEALFSGVPVIAASGSCLEEAGGRAAIYIDPHQPSELAMAIDWILSNPHVYQNLKHESTKQVEKFSPEKLSMKLKQIYTSLV